MPSRSRYAHPSAGPNEASDLIVLGAPYVEALG